MERFIKRADINYNEKKNGKKGLLKSKKTRIEITTIHFIGILCPQLKSKKTRIEMIHDEKGRVFVQDELKSKKTRIEIIQEATHSKWRRRCVKIQENKD